MSASSPGECLPLVWGGGGEGGGVCLWSAGLPLVSESLPLVGVGGMHALGQTDIPPCEQKD